MTFSTVDLMSFSIAYRYQAYGMDDYHWRCCAQPSGRSGRWCRFLPVHLQRIRNVHRRVLPRGSP